MDINIQRGEGISQAIKRKLDETGAKSYNASIWTNIMNALNDDSSAIVRKNGKQEKIGDLWTALSSRVMTFVGDILRIAEGTWKKIEGFVSSTSSSSSSSRSGAAASGDNNVNAPTVTLPKINQENRREQAQKVASSLKYLLTPPTVLKEARELLEDNKGIMAYVVEAYNKDGGDLARDIDNIFRFGFGWDKTDVYKMVLKPLQDKAKSYRIEYKKVTEESSLSDMKSEINRLSKAIIEYETRYSNNLDRSQNVVNESLSILQKVANDSSCINITKNDEKKYKKAELKDGSCIIAHYNNNGTIDYVAIKNKTNHFYNTTDVTFTKDTVMIEGDKDDGRYDYYVKHNGNDILELAKKIFGETWDE